MSTSEQRRKRRKWITVEKIARPSHPYYLTRYRILALPWIGIYLHRFDGPDPDDYMHDHPWSFVSFVLKGGYSEHVPFVGRDGRVSGTMVRTVGPATRGSRYWGPTLRYRVASRINRKAATDSHKIFHLWRIPTWTLVIRGRREREWGFWIPSNRPDVDPAWMTEENFMALHWPDQAGLTDEPASSGAITSQA